MDLTLPSEKDITWVKCLLLLLASTSTLLHAPALDGNAAVPPHMDLGRDVSRFVINTDQLAKQSQRTSRNSTKSRTT
jgi:hypothetical protein